MFFTFDKEEIRLLKIRNQHLAKAAESKRTEEAYQALYKEMRSYMQSYETAEKLIQDYLKKILELEIKLKMMSERYES